MVRTSRSVRFYERSTPRVGGASGFERLPKPQTGPLELLFRYLVPGASNKTVIIVVVLMVMMMRFLGPRNQMMR